MGAFKLPSVSSSNGRSDRSDRSDRRSLAKSPLLPQHPQVQRTEGWELSSLRCFPSIRKCKERKDGSFQGATRFLSNLNGRYDRSFRSFRSALTGKSPLSPQCPQVQRMEGWELSRGKFCSFVLRVAIFSFADCSFFPFAHSCLCSHTSVWRNRAFHDLASLAHSFRSIHSVHPGWHCMCRSRPG
ncbi:hypothetical protein HD554DRAFT_558749 [Boletus coccyginus]|nr:hypothetical protein HD554DRAFT_558749 [Boletus coccyginus]